MVRQYMSARNVKMLILYAQQFLCKNGNERTQHPEAGELSLAPETPAAGVGSLIRLQSHHLLPYLSLFF